MTGILGGLIGSTSAGPRLIGFSTGVQTTSNLPVVLSVPLGTQVGDLLVVYVGALVGSAAWPDNAGWTERYDILGRLVTTRIWDGGSSTYSFNAMLNANKVAAMLSFRSSSFGLAHGLGSNGLNPTAPSINVPANNSILLAVASNVSNSGLSFSAPSGWTRIVNLTSPISLSVIIKDTPQPSGASGTTTLTRTSGTASTNRAQHISISPA